MSQMLNVRQVSVRDLELAETCLVTLRPKKLKKGNTQCDDDARPQHGGVVNHLVPTTGEVEEGRTRSPGGQDGHEDDNSGCPKKALETDGVEGGDRVLCHDLFFDDKLGCGEELSEQDKKRYQGQPWWMQRSRVY